MWGVAATGDEQRFDLRRWTRKVRAIQPVTGN